MQNRPSPLLIKKKQLETKDKINNISNKQLHSRRGIALLAKGKATAVKLMAPHKINGKGNYKGKKHSVDNNYGRSRIDAKEERKTCNKF